MSLLPGVTRVDIDIPNNVWWTDAFQFGTIGDTSWSLNGKSFICDVKRNKDDTVPLVSLSSTNTLVGALPFTLVVVDPVQRILQFMVNDHDIRAKLPPTDPDGEPPIDDYHHDLVMVDSITGQRDMLMYGRLGVKIGVTVED